MEWNTIVVLSTIGAFFACFGIFAFVAQLERKSIARASSEVPSTEAIALSEDEVDQNAVAVGYFDAGDACEQGNDARLGLPDGWTEMFGCWAGSVDDQPYQRIGDHRH